MGSVKDRTDHPSIAALERWKHAHHGEKYIGETKVFTVQFDPNFDQFAANVAYAMRFLIVYRTDGGRTARGLVRLNGDLMRTHYDLSGSVPKGAKIRLLARLYRRQDPAAVNRWVLAIQFAIPTDDLIRGDSESVVASLAVTHQSRQTLMEQMLHDLIIMFDDVHRFPGVHADRIRNMLKIADRLGYPRNWNLWFYSEPAVFEYVRWEAGPTARKRMTAATQSKLPFDGDTGPGTSHVPWRNYPFQDAVQACSGTDRAACANIAGNVMINAEKQMDMTYNAINKELSRVAFGASITLTFSTKAPKSSDLLGPGVTDFLVHLSALAKDPDTLYSVF